MQPGSIRSLIVIVVCLGLCAGCDTSTVSYSAPVNVTFKAKSKKNQLGRLFGEKAMDAEIGDPYGAFISEARARMGRDPSVIQIERAELVLTAASKGVTRLDEVLAGDMELVFSMNETNSTYAVGAGALAASTLEGALPFGISFQSDDVPDLDYVKLLAGAFKVVAQGATAPGFDPGQIEEESTDSTGNAGNIKIELQLAMMFSAFE